MALRRAVVVPGRSVSSFVSIVSWYECSEIVSAARASSLSLQFLVCVTSRLLKSPSSLAVCRDAAWISWRWRPFHPAFSAPRPCGLLCRLWWLPSARNFLVHGGRVSRQHTASARSGGVVWPTPGDATFSTGMPSSGRGWSLRTNYFSIIVVCPFPVMVRKWIPWLLERSFRITLRIRVQCLWLLF